MGILKVENLTKIYGKDNNKVIALDNVSFSVEKEEFNAMIKHKYLIKEAEKIINGYIKNIDNNIE